MTDILKIAGKIKINEFDKSFYTDDHDVPITCLGEQVIAIGTGFDMWGAKEATHMRWKFDPDREYEIIIRMKDREPLDQCEQEEKE